MKLAPLVQLNDGTSIPFIGLGTYKGGVIGDDGGKDVGQVEQAVMWAIDAGYRHIDGALLYENEDEVGRAVNAKVRQGVVTRQEMYICTKLWNNAHHPDRVEGACRQSLKNLGLEYVDLYLMHYPTAFKDGDELMPVGQDNKYVFGDTDILDTWRAMEKLVQKGLTKSIGVSNFNSVQLKRLLANCTIKPVVNQVENHPYLNQKKLISLCRQHDIVVVAYSPFGSPESPWSKGREQRLLDDETIAAVANKYRKTPGQIVLRYLVQKGSVPIPKSVTKSRIEENFDIFDFQISSQDMETLDALNQNRRVCCFIEALGHPEYPFEIEF